MEKNLLITLLLLFLFWGAAVMASAEGKKNCRFRSRTRCGPQEKCDPHDCAMYCKEGRYEDSECAGMNGLVCYCLRGCLNSTEPQPPLPPHHRRLRLGIKCAAMD